MSIYSDPNRVFVRIPYRTDQGIDPGNNLWLLVAAALREQDRVPKHGGLRRLLRSDDGLDPRYAIAVFEIDTLYVDPDLDEGFDVPDGELREWEVDVETRQYHRVRVFALSEKEAFELAEKMVEDGGGDPWSLEDAEATHAREIPRTQPLEAKAS